MTAAERGVLLLCAALRESEKPLTMAQFRELSLRVQAMGAPEEDPLRELSVRDLRRLGYEEAKSARILSLLSREAALDAALAKAERQGIFSLTRITAAYPPRLARKLGVNCPPVLFFKGDARLAHRPCVSLVGSRQLMQRGRAFAHRVGELCAKEGDVLVSGGADGADTEAQEACLAAGGSVIVFTAGRLTDCRERENLLYVSEAGFDLPFSTIRAMQRNRLIHAMGEKTLVAQCSHGTGGTWHGSLDNLKHGYSPLYVCKDSGDGAAALCELGATAVAELTDLKHLTPLQLSLFEENED